MRGTSPCWGQRAGRREGRTVGHGADRHSRNKLGDSLAHRCDDADGLKARAERQQGERLLLAAKVLAAREVHVAARKPGNRGGSGFCFAFIVQI